MVVTSTAVCTVTAGVHRHWLLGLIGSNVNQCWIALRSSTTNRDGVERQRSYLISRCPTLQVPVPPYDKWFLYYSPKKVCQIIVACCMLHNLALRQQVPFLQEVGPAGGLVAAVEPVDSEEEEAKEEDINNRNNVIQQDFQ
ncbi:hypothetical protein NDU88_003598 [Pleurodeles waltl]|uniref:Nuclease HARBI1 n=1 Tax=Pleurodeles waltl TaxID=8319 RepID=A0AAV7WPI6_PLEWA|nr:hypothetical protein NDU88_003598 [Pleurodeles waltl]